MQRNTLVTISDNKVGVDANADNSADFYEARVLSATDYYAFGMSMKERTFQAESYRFGFNGKERDEDIENEAYDFGARIYNSKIGRWMAVDPLAGKYPSLSPYNFVANNPLTFVDPDGRKIRIYYKNSQGFDDYVDYEYGSEYNIKLTQGEHNQFVEDVFTMFNHLIKEGLEEVNISFKDHPVFGNRQITNDKIVKFIAEGTNFTMDINESAKFGYDFFSAFDNYLGITPRAGLNYDDGIIKGQLSPVLCFLHELGHAYFYYRLTFTILKGKKVYDKKENNMVYEGWLKHLELSTESEKAGNYESESERLVMVYIERPAAEKSNQKGKNEVIRTSHKEEHHLDGYETKDPLSTTARGN